MLSRLQRLHEDKLAGLNAEVEEIIQAIDRAEVDQKDACEVVFALRLDILKNIVCDSATPANTVYDATDTREFREYEGMYDDFHYDIGHGKGTGEGTTTTKGEEPRTFQYQISPSSFCTAEETRSLASSGGNDVRFKKAR